MTFCHIHSLFLFFDILYDDELHMLKSNEIYVMLFYKSLLSFKIGVNHPT